MEREDEQVVPELCAAPGVRLQQPLPQSQLVHVQQTFAGYHVKPPVVAAAPFVPASDAWMPVTSDTSRLAGTKRKAHSQLDNHNVVPFAMPLAAAQIPAVFFQAPGAVVPQQYDAAALAGLPAVVPQQHWGIPAAYAGVVQQRTQEDINYNHPDIEIRKRPRWETPRRRGNWPEDWECAKQLSDHVIPAVQAKGTSAAVRSVLSHVILSNVSLTSATVEKWLNLLSEFLELNVDEHMLLLCLIRKYLKNGHSLASGVEYSRPQRWECVIGIGCYFAVMLSEEFPGRTGLDLRDLLGGNFCFARDQLRFLKAVDWKINVSAEEFADAKSMVAQYEASKVSSSDMMKWLGARTSMVVGTVKSVVGGPEVTGKMPKMSVGSPECDLNDEALAEVPEVPGM